MVGDRSDRVRKLRESVSLSRLHISPRIIMTGERPGGDMEEKVPCDGEERELLKLGI